MATDHNFRIKNGLDVQGANATIVSDGGDTRITSSGEFRFRPEGSTSNKVRFTLNTVHISGSLDASANVDGNAFRINGTSVIDSSRNTNFNNSNAVSFLSTNGYWVGGTRRIDGSGNLENIGNITATGDLTLTTTGSKIILDAYSTSQEGGGIFFREGFSNSNIYNHSIIARSRGNDGSADGLSINAYEGVAFSTGSNSYNERLHVHTKINASVPYAMGDTNVIDTSRNLLNIASATISGDVLINGATNNSGKADFAVGVGGSPQLSLYGNQVQIGGTDMNWNAKFFHDSSGGHVAVWNNNLELFTQGSNTGSATARDIIFSPQIGGTALATERMRLRGADGILEVGNGLGGLVIDSGGDKETVEGRRYNWYLMGMSTQTDYFKICTVTVGTGLYKALAMKVIIESQLGNYGHTSHVTTSEYNVAYYRSSNVQDNENKATIYGQNPVSHNLRVMKTATGTYELQIKQNSSYRDALVKIQVLSSNGGTIEMSNGKVTGSSSGTEYTASKNAGAENIFPGKVNAKRFESAADTSNSVPVFTFDGDEDTGLGYIGSNSPGLIAAGSRKFYVNSTNAYFQNLSGGTTFDNDVSVPNISVADDIKHTGDSDTNISFEANSIIMHAGGSKGFSMDSSAFVVNQDSLSYDFRVESNGQTHMLFVDGSADRVGIGTNAPAQTFNVYGRTLLDAGNYSATAANLSEASTIYALGIKNRTSGANLHFSGNSSYVSIQALTTSPIVAKNIALNPFGGRVGIGTTSPGAPFHVNATAMTGADIAYFANSNGVRKAKFHLSGAGDGQLSLLDGNNNINVLLSALGTSYLNAGNGNVGIGTTSPGYKLEVAEDTNSTADLLMLRNSDSTYAQTWAFQSDTAKDLVITGSSGSGGIKLVPGSRGVTVSGNLIGSDIKASGSGGLTLQTDEGTKRLEILDSGVIKFNQAYSFPTSDGSSGQVLQTDGSGNLSFATSSGGVSLSNGANNRIVTATSASSINAEANLQYDGSALDIYTGSIPVTDNHVGLTFRQTGTYSDGRYEHRFRKRDEGGGIPLYIDKTSGTANAHTAIVRFGGYSANTQEFEVYGNAKVDNLEVTSEGSTSTLTLGKYDSTDQGVLYLTGSTANKQSVLKTTNGNLHLDSASGNNTYINFYTGAGTYFGSGAGGISAVMGADGDLWKGNADNTGSKYWHAGNDGAGSGLDADTLDGYDLGAIDHAEGFKVWTGINADTTQAKRRVIGRLYGCPNHWNNNWHNIEITVTSEYYESGYAKYRIMGDYGSGSAGMLNLYLVESHGPMIPRARIVLGSAVDAGWDSGGQDVFYQDLYADAAFYGQFKVHAKTYGHGYQTSNPTSGAGITVFYASPSVSNISDFTDSKTTTYQQGYTIWNSGNDGTGSGLDADTVDGIQSASLLRSDASDTYSSGTLTFGSGSGLDLATFDIYPSMRVIRNNKASSDGMYIGYLNTNSGHTRIFGGGQGSGGIRVQGSGNNDIKMGSSAGTAWHSANDGSGSGLDADTVDGTHASSFIQQGTNAVGNSSFSNTIGEGFRLQRVTGGSNRFYSSHHNLLQLPNTSGDMYVAQLAMGTGDAKIGWRGKTNTTWTSWYDIWHSGNDGSGSSLDADLLDGSEGSYYRNASNINAGTLSSGRMPSTPPNTYIYGDDTLGAFGSSTFAVNPPRMGFFNINNSSAENPAGFGYWQGLHFRHNNQSNTWGWQLAGTYNTSYDDLYFRQVTSGSRGSWNKIWSTNNDGAGSGLDADTLDGVQGTNYKRNDQTGNTAEPGPYYSTGTYIYDTTNSTRYYWLLLGTIAASSCKGSIEYEAKDDENYPHFVKGTIAYGGFNSGTSFSVQHDQHTADPFGVQVRLDTSRRIWIRFPNCDWSHFFRFRVHDANGNFTTNTSWSTGTTRYDTAGSPSSPPNSSSDILGGQNLRATSSSVTGTVPSYSNFQYFPKVFARGRIEVDNNLVFHAGNDGAGSGLDADTVDGVQLANLARKDVAQVFGVDTSNNVQNVSNYFRRNNTGSYTTAPLLVESYGGAGSTTGIGFHISGQVGRYLYMSDSGVLYWNDSSSKIWHASNDGSGSGLDADTVDGVQPSSMSVNSANQSHMVTGSAFSTSAAPDSVLEYQQASGQTDTKLAPSTNWHNTIRMGHGDPYTYYSNTLAVRMTGSGLGDIYSQTISNNNAQGWNKHWHTNNDGSGSGLDADLLDGLHGNSYLRIDSSSPSPQLVPVATIKRFNSQSAINTTSGSQSSLEVYGNNGSGTDAFMTFHVEGDYALYFGLDGGTNDLAVGGWSKGANSYKVWHAGNDGSGSGLDADKLDGNEASQFIRSDTGTVPSARISGDYSIRSTRTVGQLKAHDDRTIEPNAINSQSLQFGFTSFGNNNSSPYADYLHLRSYGDSSGGNDNLVMFSKGSKNMRLYQQSWNSSTAYSSYVDFWHTGNDGSGSGLDADTLDGNHATAFPKLAGTNTYTTNGVNYFRIERGGTSGSLNTANLQVYTTGSNSAYMSFHRSGQYAVNFGLDSDNILRIGGWSASANRWVLDMSGNMTVAGDVTAFSDIRLKENIEIIPNAIEKVKQIRGITFTRNDHEDKDTRHTGVIAQEVEKVLPEVVSEDNEGVKNVAYGNMVGLLIEAIKTQQEQIEELKQQVQDLGNQK